MKEVNLLEMDKYVFNHDLLIARKAELEAMQTVEPTTQFWEEELERCKDPRYFFNHYWTINGKPVDPGSEEKWNEYKKWQEDMRKVMFNRPITYNPPLTADESFIGSRRNRIKLKDKK